MRMYHGSTILFKEFDLAHVLEGDGKVKFGYGIYLTSSFASAAHYSGVKESASSHYVYTVEIPEISEDNHIAFKRPVNASIIKRAEASLGNLIPVIVQKDGKEFRKYLAKCLTGAIDLAGEKAAAEFLDDIGVHFIIWPYSWRNPQLGFNCAVFKEQIVRIIEVHQIELDANKKLINGSQKTIWSEK